MEGLGNKLSHYSLQKLSYYAIPFSCLCSGEGDSDSPKVMLKGHQSPFENPQAHTCTQCIDGTAKGKGLIQGHTQSWWLWRGEAPNLLLFFNFKYFII